jgi:hypothetical protein
VIPIFLRELEAIFSWLLTASSQASVLALLVGLLQMVLRSRLNPRWRYALWLLVMARLLLPVLPESALSLFQFAPKPPAQLATTVALPGSRFLPASLIPHRPTRDRRSGPTTRFPLSPCSRSSGWVAR